MSVARILAIILAMPAGVLVGQAAATPPVQVELTTQTTSVASGGCLVVKATVENVSGQGVRLPLLPPMPFDAPQQADRLFDMSVLDAHGRPAPPTAFGRTRPGGFTWGSQISITLAPGDHRVATLLVGRRFDLTVPGTYTIRVTLKGVRPAAVSNPLVITVVDSPPPS